MLNFIKEQWRRPVSRFAIIVSAVMICLVTTLSLLPVQDLPKAPGNDKLHHFIAYFAIIFPLAVARWRLAKWAAPAIVFYSGLIELIQPLSNRYSEWADLGANTLGVLLGLGIGFIIGPSVMQKVPKTWR